MAESTMKHRQSSIDKIKATLVLKKLQKHVLDGEAMSQTQVQAAKILLAKVIPDQKAVEHTGEMAVQVSAIKREIIF